MWGHFWPIWDPVASRWKDVDEQLEWACAAANTNVSKQLHELVTAWVQISNSLKAALIYSNPAKQWKEKSRESSGGNPWDWKIWVKLQTTKMGRISFILVGATGVLSSSVSLRASW